MPVRMTVLLDEEVDARLTTFCQQHGCKKSTLTAKLIRDYLESDGAPQGGVVRPSAEPVSKKKGRKINAITR